MEFTHSIVLFSGDDGLPLEFNVRNTNEKSLLKAMIEHGGGLCTQTDNAVHLISPGTKVLNADLGKKLVSSRYIFDCVDQNYLLEVNDYVFTISEEPTSDISDEDEERGLIGNKSSKQLKEKLTDLISNIDFSTTDEKESRIGSIFSTPSKLSSTNQKSLTSSNQSESFIEGSQDTSHNPRIAGGISIQKYGCIPLTSTAKEPDSMDMPIDNYEDIEQDLSPIQASASLVNPPIRKIVPSQNEENSSPEKVRFNQKILSPDRAPILSQQAKTLTKVNDIGRSGLSPNKASAFQVSPKRVTVVPSHDGMNSPKQLGKNNASPNRASFVIHQKETSACEIATTENGNSNNVEMSPDPSIEDVAFNASPPKSSTILRYERIDDSEEEEEVVPNRVSVAASPLHTAVSSSQQGLGEFDQFDNMLISKAQQQIPSDDEDKLSQSYTVSSSADAQKPSSGEMFTAGLASQLPDSPTNDQPKAEDELDEQSLYIKRLEAEVEKILLKPSPKSIQDKICLVKYICCVKKLSPAIVLQSLDKL